MGLMLIGAMSLGLQVGIRVKGLGLRASCQGFLYYECMVYVRTERATKLPASVVEGRSIHFVKLMCLGV